jgi:hypothetical protein
MSAPIGVPSAVDAVKPVMTIARAKPRFSGVTMAAAAPVAVGANIAAPRPAKDRVARASSKFGARAVARFATTKMARLDRSKILRGTRAATAAIAGAIRA